MKKIVPSESNCGGKRDREESPELPVKLFNPNKYSKLSEFFGGEINNTELKNPKALQYKKTPNKECELSKSLPSNSMMPREDKSSSRLTSAVKNLKL